MEEQMLNLFTNLSQNKDVAVIEKLSIASYPEVIDTHGAIAMEGVANVVTLF
jgi:hypothetical protein